MSPADALRRMVRDFEDDARAANRRIADRMAADMKALVARPYPPASRPGEPPRRRSGDLHDGIDVHVTKKDNFQVVAPEYGPYLDAGTETVAARPWIDPVFERFEDYADDEMRRGT